MLTANCVLAVLSPIPYFLEKITYYFLNLAYLANI